MKKKGKMSKWIGSILITALLVPSLAASANGVTGILVDRVEHSDELFSQYDYYRMEESDFDAIVNSLSELAEQDNNADAVMDVIIGMEDYFCEMNAMYSIANIYSTLDAANDAYDEEVKYYDELWTNVCDKVMLNYQIVANSQYSEELRERIDNEDDWQDILDYVPMTDEQKELSAKETELELRYDELYNENYYASINGQTYSEEELEEAYADGTVDFQGYLEGLGQTITQRNEALGNLFLELLEVRVAIAQSYGYDNYADYAYDKIYGRDYTPDDLTEYRRQVKEYVTPLSDELYNKLFDECYDEYQEMWEQEVTEEQCLNALYDYLPEISEDMLVPLNYMVDHELYDISVDEAKAPGGYTSSITVYNAPFMFNCASGDFSDMNTVIHEFGHYNQMYYRSQDEWYYDSTDLDLAEINSQGLELLYMEFSDELYGEYADVMNYYNAFNQTYSTIEGCKEDAFQYAIYSEPEGMTLEKLNQLYFDMCEEYNDLQLYNSYYLGLYGVLDDDCIYEWVEIPHTFQSPLYYISYSISMSAVEELRDVILEDREEGINIYLELAAKGAEDSFQETVESVGLNNPIQNPRFDEYTENIRISIGLSEASSDSVVLEDEEEEEIDDAEDTEIREEDEEDEEEDDRSSRHSSRRDRDEDEEDSSAQMPVVIIVIATALLLVIVTIIVLVIVLSNRKKKEEDVPVNPVPGAPIPPMQNNGAPVAPMQGNPMNMQPGNPYMPPMQNNGAPIAPMQGNPMNVQPGNPYMPPMQNNEAPMPPVPDNDSSVPPTSGSVATDSTAQDSEVTGSENNGQNQTP